MFQLLRFLSVACFLLACRNVHADILQFNVTLDGSQEVPATGSPGSGVATAVFNNLTGEMTISGSYTGLAGTVNNAHLHGYAATGANAGVVFGLTHTGGNSGTFSGSGTIPGADIANVLNGLTYINIHSTVNTGGEIRGQLINPIPEPAGGLILGIAALSTLLRRRK
jgi:hypothetical protein